MFSDQANCMLVQIVEQRLSTESNYLSDVVPVVNEKEDLLPKILAIRAAEILVKFLVKSDIVLRLDTKHLVTAISLVDVVDVVEDIRSEVLKDEFPHVVDIRQLEDST